MPLPPQYTLPVYKMNINKYDENFQLENITEIKTETLKILKGTIASLPIAYPLSLPLSKDTLLLYSKETKNIRSLPIVKILNGKGHTAEVLFYPVIYNAQDSTITFLSKIQVEMDQYIYDKKEDFTQRNTILIISPVSFRNAVNKYEGWRKKQGYTVLTEWTYRIKYYYEGRDMAEKIRNCIKDYYYNNNIKWVLLIGDTDSIPARWGYAFTCGAGIRSDEDSLYTDLYYSDIDDDWDRNNNGVWGESDDSLNLYPEVFVGRLPADDSIQANRMISRILNYEQNPIMPVDSGLFMGMVLWDDLYTPAGVLKEEIKEKYIPNNMNIETCYEYDNSGGKEKAYTLMNKGVYIYNHAGHGWWTAIGLSDNYIWWTDVDTLQNGNRAGIFYSIGCWTAAFDRDDSFAEHMLSAENGGMLAYIGNSRYGWGSPGNSGYGYSDIFDKKFFEYFYSDTFMTIGEVFANYKIFYIPEALYPNLYRWHEFIINLLGDPVMLIHTQRLKYFIIKHTDAVENMPIYINVSPYYSNTNWIVGIITNKDNLYQFRGRGYKKIRIDPFWQEGDTVYLTITGTNHFAYEETLFVERSSRYRLSYEDFVNDSFKLFLYVDSLENSSYCTINALSYNDTITIDPIYSSDTVLINPYPFNDMDSTIFFRWFSEETTFVEDTFYRYSNTFIECSLDTAYIENSIAYIRFDFNCNNLENVKVYSENVSIINSYYDNNYLFVECSYKNKMSMFIEWDYNDRHYSQLINIPVYGTEGIDEHFENDNNWYYGGEWHLETKRVYDGNFSVYCGGEDYVYLPNKEDTLISPLFLLPDKAVLKFAHWYDMPFLENSINGIVSCDGMYIKIGRDSLWEGVNFIGSGGALNNKGIPDWFVSHYDISSLDHFVAGDSVRLMFLFKSDATEEREGWYIDNISVSTDGLPLAQELSNYSENNFYYIMREDRMEVNARELEIYDLAGRLVFNAAQKNDDPIVWDYKDKNNKNIKSGIYIMKTDRDTNKILFIRR